GGPPPWRPSRSARHEAGAVPSPLPARARAEPSPSPISPGFRAGARARARTGNDRPGGGGPGFRPGGGENGHTTQPFSRGLARGGGKTGHPAWSAAGIVLVGGPQAGADRDTPGWLELCPSGGQLFLDEIAELDVSLQPTLLRVIQSRTFQRQ